MEKKRKIQKKAKRTKKSLHTKRKATVRKKAAREPVKKEKQDAQDAGKRRGILANSFRRMDSSLWKIILIDFTSYVLVLSLIIFLWKLFRDRIISLHLPESVFQLTQNQVLVVSANIESSFYYLFFLTIIFFLMMVIVWSVSRALIWKMSLKEKINRDYIWKSIPLGIVWFGIGSIPGIVLLLTLKQTYLFYVITGYVLFLVYFSNILFIRYAMHGRLNIFGPVIKEGARRMDDLGMAYVLVLIVYFLLRKMILYTVVSAMALAGLIIAVIVHLLYFAWSRYFLIEVHRRKGLHLLS